MLSTAITVAVLLGSSITAAMADDFTGQCEVTKVIENKKGFEWSLEIKYPKHMTLELRNGRLVGRYTDQWITRANLSWSPSSIRVATCCWCTAAQEPRSRQRSRPFTTSSSSRASCMRSSLLTTSCSSGLPNANELAPYSEKRQRKLPLLVGILVDGRRLELPTSALRTRGANADNPFVHRLLAGSPSGRVLSAKTCVECWDSAGCCTAYEHKTRHTRPQRTVINSPTHVGSARTASDHLQSAD